jgi:cytochrome c553
MAAHGVREHARGVSSTGGAPDAPAAAMTTRRLLLVVGLISADAVAEPRRAEQLVDKIVAAQRRMHARFVATNLLRTAIATGDSKRATTEARMIADLAEPDFLPEWQPHVDAVRAAAAQVAGAADPIAAARGMGQLGRRCAQCHEAAKAKIAFPRVQVPREDPKLRGRMTAHAWATSRLWEGLVGPSPVLWTDGANALAAAPLTIVAEGEVGGRELGIAADVARVRLLATRAKTATTSGERAELYGDILSTCARCHAVIRDR